MRQRAKEDLITAMGGRCCHRPRHRHDLLAPQVHSHRPSLPILYMSGYPRDDVVLRGLLRRDQPFLQKPFTGQELADAVAGSLTGSGSGGGRVTPALSSG